jgi:hypothetical protein
MAKSGGPKIGNSDRRATGAWTGCGGDICKVVCIPADVRGFSITVILHSSRSMIREMTSYMTTPIRLALLSPKSTAAQRSKDGVWASLLGEFLP